MRIGFSVVAYWASVALGVVTIVLVGTNFAVLTSNQSIQAEVNQRQQFIDQNPQLRRADEMLIRAIATAAVNAKDDKLHDLLTQQGITMAPTAGDTTSDTPAAPGTAAPAAAPTDAAPATPAAPPPAASAVAPPAATPHAAAAPATPGNKAP